MSTNIKWGLVSAVCVAALANAACSGSSSPAAASTTTTTTAATPAPVAPPAPVVVLTGSVQITVTPNPVAFSGVPITDSAGCAGSPNTWFYNQDFKETGGVAVTFTSRVDTFDQRVVNTLNNLNLTVAAMGSTSVASRWCSSADIFHTAQSTFTGTDANGHLVKVEGPVVTMRSLH